MIQLGSSLRIRPISESLQIALAFAATRGVSRITGTTALDRIGLPVYSGIRPGALEGSLCVSAGKGLTEEEARIGACMEAVELSFAEYGRSHVDFRVVPVDDMLASFPAGLTFEDCCPLMGTKLDVDERVAVVEAESMGADCTVLIPAELVFLPFLENPGEAKFGSSSVGLASGNSVEEASVHALAEIIEHDIASFDFVQDRSLLVNTLTAPSSVRKIVERMESADFDVYLRFTRNEFNLPYFRAMLFDNTDSADVACCAGFGMHPIVEIAAVRALTEAAQSRLSAIHGGRDDLTKYPAAWADLGRDQELEAIRELRQAVSDQSRCVAFSELDQPSLSSSSLAAAWELMADRLRANGIQHIFRVVLTRTSDPMAVVKLIVPKLEDFEAESLRVGPRLRAYVNSL